MVARHTKCWTGKKRYLIDCNMIIDYNMQRAPPARPPSSFFKNKNKKMRSEPASCAILNVAHEGRWGFTHKVVLAAS